MTPVHAVLLVAIGLVSGVVNTLAGGGTLLTVPAMILLGYPALTANATNRATLVVQSLSAVSLYRRRGTGEWRLAAGLSVTACAGGAAGAWLATRLPERTFGHALAILMVGAFLFLLLHPAQWFARRRDAGPPHAALTHLGFLAVGLYGGFFGAGIGVLILLILSAAHRLDLVAGNVVKSFVVLVLSLAAALVFAALGAVDWVAALPLAAGNALGGWVGAHLSLKGGDRWIRRALLLVVLASLYKLLG